jgi:hypothetical protein
MKWENRDSNSSGSDLQSVLATPALFPFAEGGGIEPLSLRPRRFSRPFAPMRGTIQAESCGPDPQTFYRSRDLAGRPYPSRLTLQRDSNQNRTDIDIVLQTKPETNIRYTVFCAPDRSRTYRISGLSGTRLPVTSQARKYPRKDSNLQTPEPKSGAFTNLTTQAKNKKASDFSKAVVFISRQFQVNAIQPRPLERYKYELYSEHLIISQTYKNF